MNNFSDEILVFSDSINLILIFITVLFGIRYPQIIEDLKREIPSGTKAKKRIKDQLITSLALKCLPNILISLFSCYLFLPSVIKVLNEYEFDFWGFDFAITAFMFITFMIFFFFVWSCFLFVKLLVRIIKF
jgi:hypothetical protein